MAEANSGQAPGEKLFAKETGIKQHEWRGVYWARWGDALAEAGLAPNEMQGRFDRKLVLQKLADATRHYGKLPTDTEIMMFRQVDSATPSHKTVARHFHGRENMLSQLREWVAENPAYVDIAALLPSKPLEAPVRSAAVPEGYVYLIKSGSHYKIGRSDELERRIKEIKIALPEAATLVHTIKTDDPSGIEAYWHRRFAAKRANGEWFKLTTADLAAFKKRKYQ